eukprot:Nk52_evm11s1945 gene=Nk52_evmTU11s1945
MSLANSNEPNVVGDVEQEIMYGEGLDAKKGMDNAPKAYSDMSGEERREVDELIEETQLTIRALLLGGLAGALVCVSNLYVTLKIGWSFSSSQFAALVAFALIKPLSKTKGPWSGYFGPKENVTAQTAGTAAGMLSAGFGYSIPALYWVGAITSDVTDEIASFLLFTTGFAFFGMFFAVPLRSYAILKQKLVFPTGTSTAYLIKSIHEGAEGATKAIKQVKVMIVFFIFALLYTIFLVKVPIMGNWYIFSYCENSSSFCSAAQTLGWMIVFDPQQIGAGMIMGFNAATSMIIGAITAWVVIAPILKSTNSVDQYINFDVNDPGANYVLIWPGIFMMITAAFMELFVQYEILISAGKSLVAPIRRLFNKNKGVLQVATEEIDEDEDPAPKNEQIPTWMWISGTLASTVLTLIVLDLYFDVKWYESLIASLLGVILSFVCVQSAGRTDINPITMVGKSTQLIFAGISPNSASVNLWAASTAAGAAGQSVDMLQDLKTGHILRASPRNQFYAQIVGTIFGIVASVFGFILFSKAYPCILESQLVDNPPDCPFAMPSVYAWAALAEGLTQGIDKAIPAESAWITLAMCLFAVFLVILRHKLPEKYKPYVINPVAFSIPFLTPGINAQTIMFFIGAVIVKVWESKWPTHCATFAVIVATGCITGESIGGITNAFIVLGGGNSDAWTCAGMQSGYCTLA